MLKNRVSLITGAANGIGKCVSELFAKEGSTVCLLDINKQKLDSTLKEIKLISNLSHTSFECDVSKSKQVKQVFEEIKINYGKLLPTIIVNCAGIYYNSKIEDIHEDDLNRVIDINLKGTFYIIQESLKALEPQSMQPSNPFFNASIINISSISGSRLGIDSECVYSASKSAIIGLTRSISREIGKYNIRCNCVLPGIIRTDELLNDENRKEFVNTVKELISIRKLGDTQDVANVCLFLASNLSSYITGSCIDCSGGLNF